MKFAAKNNTLIPQNRRLCRIIAAALAVCSCFLVMMCCGCQFPYKIDPSGNCLFVKNENATLPEFSSPFTSSQGLRPNEPAVSATTTVPATPEPGYQTSIPGVTVGPGTASGIAPLATGTGVIGGESTRGTLLVPGSGPIVLVAPDEQIALIGSEVILFANYKGDDDYLRTGERIEWSLGGVGHIQTTNKTECCNFLALDFNRDKKVSDRFAVTSTLHNEGTIDRGSVDEQGKIPHLAGQSWISIQSAEEGTSTVTAFAPTIKDWNRRTSSATVHWIDAEWIYPRPDITKYNDPKIFITRVKKRSSGSPCPNWLVRYEMTGGPSAGFGPNKSKVVEVPTDGSGEAAIEFYLLEGNSGTSTVKATIIRPTGVDGGTKRLELHSSNLTNYWSSDAPLSMQTNAPPQMRWDENTECTISIDNRSDVTKTGVVTLQLPKHIRLMSSVPSPTNVMPQSDGSQRVTWHAEFPGTVKSVFTFVVQAVTDDPTLKSQPLELELNPELSMFPRETGQSALGSGTDYGTSSNVTISTPQNGQTFAPGTTSPTIPPPPPNEGFPLGGGSYAGTDVSTGTTTPTTEQGHSDPAVFAGKLKVDCYPGATMTVDQSSEIAVMVTNNATTPFYAGCVQVEVSDGLLFVDENDSRFVDANTGENATKMESLIEDNAKNEIAIPQGKQHRILFRVRPTRPGSMTIKATVFGQSPQSGWREISGATATGNTRALAQ